jgi:hypothetical protein
MRSMVAPLSFRHKRQRGLVARIGQVQSGDESPHSRKGISK